MTAPAQTREVAADYQRDQASLSSAAAQVAAQMWDEVDPDRIMSSWQAQLPELTGIVSGAQLGAARQADPYTNDVLDVQGLDPGAVADVNPAAFAGHASDGRGLMSLLTNPVFVTLASISDAADITRALSAGRANVQMLASTQVADAGRLATHTSLVAHPSATGYVRTTDGNPCSRCLPLAGKTYRWNSGFKRHPRCGCVHVPTLIAHPQWHSLDPRDIYDRMTPRERTLAGFTKGQQAALDEGADIFQVINADRGVFTAGGRQFTREGTTRRGGFGQLQRRQGLREPGVPSPPRLTPDQILIEAGEDRAQAVALLRANGYLLDVHTPPVVAVPRVFGARSGGGVARPARSVQVRQLLADARSAEQVSQTLAAELKRITGRDIPVDLRGSVVTAREHAEGVLQVIERFPQTALDEIATERLVILNAGYHHRRMIFDEGYSSLERRERYLSELAKDKQRSWHPFDSPVGVAAHEMGHALFVDTLDATARRRVQAVLRRHGGATTASRKVSGYATQDIDELVGEAMGDVIINGERSSLVSRDIMASLEADYARVTGATRTAARKATTKAAAPSPTGVEGLSRNAGIRAGQIENRIREAAVDLGNAPGARGFAQLADLRARIVGAEVTEEEFGRVLLAMKDKPDVTALAGNRVRAGVLPQTEKLRQMRAATLPSAIQIRGGAFRPVELVPSGKAAKKAAGMHAAAPSPTVLRRRVTDAGITVPTGLRPPALQRLVADLDSGMAPAAARARAVESIVDERKAVAEALAGASEQVGREASERALKAEARAIRNAVPTEALTSLRPLLDALDAGDLTAARAALPVVARGAKLKPIGEVGAVTKAPSRVEWVGPERSQTVQVLRPGYETTFEGSTTLLRPPAVMAATPEQVARLAPAKVAKKTAGRKATGTTLAQFDAAVERAAKGTPALRSSPLEFDGQAKGAARAGRGFEDAFPDAAERERIVATIGRYQFISHKEITELMRTGKHRAFSRLSAEETRAAIADIRSAMRHSRLTDDVVVWRGADGPGVFGTPDGLVDDLTGVEFGDAAFVSTSVSEQEARKFVASRRDVVMRIVVPEGTPALQLSKLGGRGGEGELLLGDGLRFRVVRDHGVIGGSRRIDVEVIPPRAPAKAAVKKAAPAKKATAPKAPPAPEKMTLPALRKELETAGIDLPLAGVPKPTLARWVDEIRTSKAPIAESVGRFRQVVIDRRRAVAEALAEADELLANGASAATLGARGRAALVKVEKAITGWPDEAPLRALVTAMATGNPASVRRAIKAAQTKLGLRQIGDDAGKLSRFDRATMKPIGGTIPDGAQVVVVRPGYEIEIGGQRVVLSKPVVEVASPIEALPRVSRPAPPAATAKATNPHHGSTQNGPAYRNAPQIGKTQSRQYTPDLGPLPFGAYEENCTNVVMAWEMRMRGYDVTAAPLDILDRYGYAAGRTYEEYEAHLLLWRNADGTPHGRTFSGQQWINDAQLEAVVLSWPEGARGLVNAGKHTFNVTKINGKMVFVEAQDAGESGLVTAKYLKRYGSKGTAGSWKVIRLDDLVPSDDILKAVVAVAP